MPPQEQQQANSNSSSSSARRNPAARRTHCALSRCSVGASADRIDLSARSDDGRALVREKPQRERRGAPRCDAKAVLGPKREGADVSPASPCNDERQAGLDQSTWRGLSGSARRRAERGSSVARQAEVLAISSPPRNREFRRVAATPSPGYVGPPEYVVIEPIEPDYIYVPIYDPTIVFGPGYWEPAYLPFFWYPPWWTVGPVFGFGPALFVGPALWYGFSWGHAGYSAIHVNHAHYSKFNKANYSGGNAGNSILLTGRWVLRIRTFNSSLGSQRQSPRH